MLLHHVMVELPEYAITVTDGAAGPRPLRHGPVDVADADPGERRAIRHGPLAVILVTAKTETLPPKAGLPLPVTSSVGPWSAVLQHPEGLDGLDVLHPCAATAAGAPTGGGAGCEGLCEEAGVECPGHQAVQVVTVFTRLDEADKMAAGRGGEVLARPIPFGVFTRSVERQRHSTVPTLQKLAHPGGVAVRAVEGEQLCYSLQLAGVERHAEEALAVPETAVWVAVLLRMTRLRGEFRHTVHQPEAAVAIKCHHTFRVAFVCGCLMSGGRLVVVEGVEEAVPRRAAVDGRQCTAGGGAWVPDGHLRHGPLIA